MKYLMMFMMFILIASCGVFIRAPKFENRSSDKYVGEPAIFCWVVDELYELCPALVLFPSGDIIGHTISFSLGEANFFSTYERLYDKTGSVNWGKYWIRGDTLYYEFAHYINMGGAVYFPKIHRKFLINDDDSVRVYPAIKHSNNLPRYFRANDTLIYVRVDYPDIHNIDPSKAWINRK